MNSRRRYAIVGTGGRSVMYFNAILEAYRDHAQLVGLCDISPTRMAWYSRLAVEHHHLSPVPRYIVGDFDNMVREQKPDVVIVTSMDSTHHEYIIRAMELGCDVISEKPMTIDAAKINAIFEAISRTGRKLRVAFNYRYAPVASALRELLARGEIGRILAVDFSWVLDTRHGADYFRRWHAQKDKSGGLLVHKATHHFDLVNWWIDSYPSTVFAMGDLKFYGRKAAEVRGEHYTYDRYTGHPEAQQDPFYFPVDGSSAEYAWATLKELYYDAEKDSGYIRDRNVFGDHVTIEDTMAVMVRYRNNVVMNYSLIAYCPWEGYRVAITGNRGRAELYVKHGSHIIAGQSDRELAAAQDQGLVEQLRVFPMFGTPYDVKIPQVEGAHGGGDTLILQNLFLPDPPPDPLCRAASHIDGAASLLVGISANESIRAGMPVQCDRLVRLPCV
ncbi:MAG: Gfo/Idh/MocA family oxidoreductase [Phycisphaerae bacterium]|nr:Gfo/Idh/MocA family oxidoreductase [Phycisphaerae bacterium]